MPEIKFSIVSDPETLRKLDAEEKRGDYLTFYRAAQLVDGKLYSPMAGKINGKWQNPIQLGKWEQAGFSFLSSQKNLMGYLCSFPVILFQILLPTLEKSPVRC